MSCIDYSYCFCYSARFGKYCGIYISMPPEIIVTELLETLRQAVAGDTAAIRRVRRLQPVGGPSDKVYPPTYSDGPYAEEERVVDGRIVKTVLLDSVQSQANRLELALLRAYREGSAKFPLLTVDFSLAADPVVSELGELTALETPHRIADAIIRDSEWNGMDFRKSELGKKFESARSQNATPLFELCPTALLFGMWDSTGTRGGLGAKFARAVVSEINGFGVIPGVRPSSRIDPLGIERNATVYATPDGDWTIDSSLAAKDKKGNPQLYGKEGKPSEINHGNVTPTLKEEKTKSFRHGGVTLDYANQTTVLSLPALRRLQFPIDGKVTSERNLAAQIVLAALALVAITSADREGYDLRSRCMLDGPTVPFEFLTAGVATPQEISFKQATALLSTAVEAASKHGLPWSTEPFVLRPKTKLQDLILKSRLSKSATPEEE